MLERLAEAVHVILLEAAWETEGLPVPEGGVAVGRHVGVQLAVTVPVLLDVLVGASVSDCVGDADRGEPLLVMVQLLDWEAEADGALADRDNDMEIV